VGDIAPAFGRAIFFWSRLLNSWIKAFAVPVLGLALCLMATPVIAVEEPAFKVLKKERDFELREYSPYVVAEIEVDATFEEAGNLAFNALFRYISGNNRGAEKIEMTAPVTQNAAGTKIEMTAPVTQQARQEGRVHVVGFVLPARFTVENAPEPGDARVKLRQVPARTVAVAQYSGTWSQPRYDRVEGELRDWLKANGWAAIGTATFARYNPPIMPWFLRRNEVQIEVAKPS
jgi:hypothetical protein